ncbi:MAG: DUF371 domain-containing protein [Methanocalculaceae archaeon]|jgi:hypothetical protein|nr:DUF371 domain-containing protein [Methanocalculaceae archaeon]
MDITEIIHCRGHRNVQALHKSTFEITKETDLSPSGDCIIAVDADLSAADLSPAFRDAVSRDGTILITTLSCGDTTVIVRSEGCSGITLTHETCLVWRRSNFLCPRTIAIYSDHSAHQFPRGLIKKLQNEEEMIVILRAVSL